MKQRLLKSTHGLPHLVPSFVLDENGCKCTSYNVLGSILACLGT